MPLSAKEYTDITALIRLILNGYPGNAAILREYLQNSDDAKATLQRFIFDERTFPNGTLVDPVLKASQGASLIAINDGLLDEGDWMALRKINSSSKQADASQTGKNGLGFRASYHLTENPHIISGRTLMILDPHHEFKAPHDGGISIDILDEGEEYQDQLLPFASYRPVGESLSAFYNGTAFRLPLRTEDQAKRSKIKTTATSIEDMRQVLHDFVANEFEEVILFLKHITCIQVVHISLEGQETCLAKVTVDLPIPPPAISSFIRRTTVVYSDGKTTSRDWQFHCVDHSKAEAKTLLGRRLGYDIEENLIKEKLAPTVEIAYPLSGSLIRGRLFTLLPVPHWTNFPVHLNAVFALDPNRQHLKNMNEVGSGVSRERMLVEWNKLIFDTWTPDIWANLIENLPSDTLCMSSWSLWPPEELGEDCYWTGLVTSLIATVTSRHLAVFPTVTFNNEIRLVRVDDPNVLLVPSNPAILLDILHDLGIFFVQPPAHILNATLALSEKCQTSLLSPQALHRILSQKPTADFDRCGDVHLQQVLDYLAFTPPQLTGNFAYICGLLLFRRANDGCRISLALNNLGTRYLIPQTQTEATLFSAHPNMLAWNSMSERLRISLSSASTGLNVGVLEPSDVCSFLNQRLQHLRFTQDEVTGVDDDHRWVVDFWSWVINWTKAADFFRVNLREVSSLFLLPTSRGSLRRLSSCILHFFDGEVFVDAWKTLGVYPISPYLPYSVVIKLRDASFIPTVRTWPYTAFLIKNCDINPPNVSVEVLESTFKDIRTSLFDSLPRSSGSALSSTEKAKLRQFPVFTTRRAFATSSRLAAIDEYCQYVDVDEDFPLPRLQAYPNVIYVDMRDSMAKSLLQLIGGIETIQKQLQILQLAVDNWEYQSPEHQDMFIDRIFSMSHQLPAKLRLSLANIPFITVNDHAHRVAPRDLIYPGSYLSDLYQGEPAKFPTGRFSQPGYLSIMLNFGFIRSNMDAHVVQDRIQYISTTSHLDDPRLHDKATLFLKFLDQYWRREYTEHIAAKRDAKWLFVAGSSVLYPPSECRDKHRDHHAHPYYYDRVWNILETTLCPLLRDALGWAVAVPFDVLLPQLLSTLELHALSATSKSDRIVKLIEYMDRLHSKEQLGKAVLQDLRECLHGRAWVPSRSLSGDVVEPRYALLEETSLKPPFCAIDQRLTRIPLLRLLGCCNRPPFSLLLDQLHIIFDLHRVQGQIFPFTSSLGREAAIAILQEIATFHQSDIPGSAIRIPCENEHAYPLDNVYFRDTKYAALSPAIQGKFAAHRAISSSLAQSLGIQLLSSINLGDDDDDYEEQMSEDLVTRIRGFLRDYDPKFALTEFLANADDARATRFSLLLDASPRLSPGRVISPAFHSLLESPFLILHNDAKMSRKDFDGIRRVGQGGKRDKTETHGRHGLGALSLYYFTDVVTIISDDTVMILDPAGGYLPPFRRRGKRTTYTRKLSEFVSLCPDQLRPYEGLFDFSQNNPVYNGTLFCLPLRAKISEKASNLVKTREYIKTSYRDIAQRGFFFTNLETITATERADGQDTHFWSFSCSRGLDRSFRDIDIRDIEIKLDSRSQSVDNWTIATSENGEVPEQHLRTAISLKLAPNNVKVQLAINIAKVESPDEKFIGFPFSTLPLPKSFSLPFHINARFAISSNRQSLVINSADGQNRKDAHTSFNTWILESLVPPLYLETLNYLIRRDQQSPSQLKSKDWWSLKGSDDVSKIVRDALTLAIPQSDAEIFKAVDGQWIAFSQAIFSKGEPKDVRVLLEKLRVACFVKSPRHSDVSRLDDAKGVDPAFVVQSVLMNTAQLLSFDQHGLQREHIYTTLDYIRNEPSLAGLPLLFLSSGVTVLTQIPGQSQDTVFYSADPSHAALFSSSSFITNDYSEDVIQSLISNGSVNVADLTSDSVLRLVDKELRILTGLDRSSWIKKFWNIHYDTLPGPPSLEVLESSGMMMIEGSISTISLTQCSPHLIVYDSTLFVCHTQWLLTILQSLQINCIDTKGFRLLGTLPPQLVDDFSKWVKSQLPVVLASWRRHQKSSPITKEKWAQLPIWNAYQNGHKRRRPATDVTVLPSHFDIGHLLPYLRGHIVLAAWSMALSSLLEHYSGNQNAVLSPYRIMNSISLPTLVTTADEIRDMANFLSSMLDFTESQLSSVVLMVPDQRGLMRSVRELYDHTNELFTSTLQFTATASFVHSAFERFVPVLRHHGLIHGTTYNTFIHCARAVSNAYRDYGPTSDRWQDIRRMSQSAFTAYQTTVPPLVWSTLGSSWENLDAIPFVERKVERRQGVSYHIQEWYCAANLPRILAPSQVVLSKYEPIAWTQRALFMVEPTERVIAVNTNLGVPSAGEVVAHLKTLTTVIANDHPGDLTLLSDIKATYIWLSEKANEARVHLENVQAEKIFLNVDDPITESWSGKWASAKEIVLNLQYDVGSIKYAREFLVSIEPLLLAAGCETLKRQNKGTDIPSPPAWSGDASTRKWKELNQLRLSGQFTDVVLVPTNDTSSRSHGFGGTDTAADVAIGGIPVSNDAPPGSHGISVALNEGETSVTDPRLACGKDETADLVIHDAQLRAHRVVLAAAIPHFLTLQTWKGVKDEVISFFGSPFGAKSMIDFAYTGELSLSTPTQNEQELVRLMCDLLELLPIAEEWGMKDLKEKIQWDIIHKHDMIQRLPHQFDILLEQARTHDAPMLVEDLERFERMHGKILQALKADQEHETNR